MTARPLRTLQPRREGFRVIRGRSAQRPRVGPFAVFGLVVVASMLGIVIARTSLDGGAFELADLNTRIATEQVRQELLILEAAELSSPTRVAPMAEEMGLVEPETRTVLLVDVPEDGSLLLVESAGTVTSREQVAMGPQP